MLHPTWRQTWILKSVLRHLVVAITVVTVTQGCQQQQHCCCEEGPDLSSISFVDRDGFSTTVKSEARLQYYCNVDYLSPQPYEKVIRIYNKDCSGNSYAYVTTYHSNGLARQYLEIRNAGAFGDYIEWHQNGQMRLKCNVIGGSPDITAEAQQTWKYDGLAEVWDDSGKLVATFNYEKGSLEGEGLRFYPNGEPYIRTPYCRDKIHGTEEMYYSDGTPLASAEWVSGNLQGHAIRYWPNGETASQEEFDGLKLLEGYYFNPDGTLASEVVAGTGFRAVFDRNKIKELHEYRKGLEEGEVKVFDDRGHLVSTYHIKEGQKHGDEVIFFVAEIGVDPLDESKRSPHLLIGWHEGKIHGITRTWYPDGGIESQREMANNRRNGIATAWYRNGSVMLMEEYENDKLKKGEYFKKGDFRPETRVSEGNGIATLYDGEGQFLRRINYYHGIVLD